MTDLEQRCETILQSPHMSILSEYSKITCPNCKGIVKYVLRKEEDIQSVTEYLSKCPFCDRVYLLKFEGGRGHTKKTIIPIEIEGMGEKIRECVDGLRSTRKIERNKRRNPPKEYEGPASWSPYIDDGRIE